MRPPGGTRKNQAFFPANPRLVRAAQKFEQLLKKIVFCDDCLRMSLNFHAASRKTNNRQGISLGEVCLHLSMHENLYRPASGFVQNHLQVRHNLSRTRRVGILRWRLRRQMHNLSRTIGRENLLQRSIGPPRPSALRSYRYKLSKFCL